MRVDSALIRACLISASWRQRLLLLLIIACFVLPLLAAWLLVDHWRPTGSAQHGQLLNPARSLDLQFDRVDRQQVENETLRGRWVLVYVGVAGQCDPRCQTALYDLRQVRLALGRDMDRVVTLLLLDRMPEDGLGWWLATEYVTLLIGVADSRTRDSLSQPFGQPSPSGDEFYLLDPLGNLLMRYPVTVDPRGVLKDLKRLLRLSKIG
ncbi:MAG: cytochrome oxidase assembly protein [Phycisphaerales bacterium]|nr:cytochrome oxidase assembly protein [Phycisphaerales bacterium]